MRRWPAIVVAALLVVGGIAVVVATGAADAREDALGRTTLAPWPAPEDVDQRVRDAGLNMLTAEGTRLHLHQHLGITVDGRAVTVPAGIGIDVVARELSPIHTHDASGIIHVESPTVRAFFLRQVFTEWDVRLGSGQLGGYRAGEGGVRIGVFVDRRPYTGDPGAIRLTSHEDIDFVVTTDGSRPAAPTRAFAFPKGY